MSNTTIYELSIRDLLGTASRFCEAIVIKLRAEKHRLDLESRAEGLRLRVQGQGSRDHG